MNEELLKAFETITTGLGGEDKTVVDEVKTKLGELAGTKDINLDNVKNFLSENDAGKEYYNNLIENTKKSSISDYTSSDEYKTAIESVRNKAIEEITAEYDKKNNKDLSDEQKEIIALRKKQEENDKRYAETEAKMLLKDITMEAIDLLRDKKLPKSVLDYTLDGTSLENTLKNIDNFSKLVQDEISKGVEAKFKEIGRDPKQGGRNTPQKITQKMLDDLATKAKNSGKIEDRVKYAETKRQFAQQTNN